MKIKQILALAAQELGREDLKAAVLGEENAPDCGEEVDNLLRCYNFIENEIALEYFPLRAEETFRVQNGRLAYTLFSHAPVDIHKAADGAGRSLKFEIFPAYLSLPKDADTVCVTYSYAPERKDIEGDSAFSGKISERLLSYGVASEFLISMARYSESDLFQKRYQDALRAAGILRRRLAMSARRWV